MRSLLSKSGARIAAVVMVAWFASWATPAGATIIPTSGINAYSWTYNGWAAEIVGVFTTQAAAQAAFNAYTSPGPNPACGNSDWGYGGGDSTGAIVTSKWGAYARIKGQYHSYFPCGTGTNQWVVWVWAKSPAWYVDTQIDTDGDGVPDYCDPDPNTNKAFQYKLVKSGKNAQGQTVWVKVELDDGRTMSFGDPGAIVGEVWHHFGEAWMPGTNLPTEIGQVVASKTTGDGAVQGVATPSITPQTGTDNTGNTVDTDYLSDIVSNTKGLVENANQANQLLQALKNELTQTKEAIVAGSAGAGGGGGGGGGITEGQTSAAVQEGTTAALEAQDAEATTEESGGWSGSATREGWTEADIPAKPSLMGQLLDAFVVGHPLAHIADTAGVNVSGGACSFTVNLMGRNVTYTMCPWQSQIGLMGAIVLGFAGVYAVLIVMGRA